MFFSSCSPDATNWPASVLGGSSHFTSRRAGFPAQFRQAGGAREKNFTRHRQPLGHRSPCRPGESRVSVSTVDGRRRRERANHHGKNWTVSSRSRREDPQLGCLVSLCGSEERTSERTSERTPIAGGGGGSRFERGPTLGRRHLLPDCSFPRAFQSCSGQLSPQATLQQK